MKFDKERFLQTEFGSRLKECAVAWDFWLSKKERTKAVHCGLQWEVYQLALLQFYGIEYHFSRTDEYFGVCTENETDWLFKIERDR